MLRIIVISLVLANLLLLGFQASRPAREELLPVTPAITENPDIPTLHLFDELIQNQELVAGNRHCFSLGPFHTVEERIRVRSQLRGIVTAISERQTQAMVDKGYWVFLPPYASLLEANRSLLSLRALGLQDIAIIQGEGEWKNAISLGYFMRQENANRRRQQLQERGYDAQVRVSRNAEPRYWLDYEQAPGVSLLELDLQNFPNDFTKRALPCPDLGFFSTRKSEPVENSFGAVPDVESVGVAGDGNG